MRELGKAGENDSASASYGATLYDGRIWHAVYLGTPHTSPAPDLVPAFPPTYAPSTVRPIAMGQDSSKTRWTSAAARLLAFWDSGAGTFGR